jgi:hypothetical protein
VVQRTEIEQIVTFQRVIINFFTHPSTDE